jgi:hypothetical protein
MQEHSEAQLVDAYIAVKQQIHELEARQEALRAQIEELSRRTRATTITGGTGALSVRWSRGLKVVDRDDVLGALDGRGLLRLFVVIQPAKLFEVAQHTPALREQLGASVKETEQAVVRIRTPA